MKVVIDVNTIPSDYKEEDGKVNYKKYADDFGIEIIPIDVSMQNTGGSYFVPKIIN